LLVKTLVVFSACALPQLVWAHALGTDPTVIERIDAGLMLPSEISVVWMFWLLFGLWIAQNLDRAPYFFIGGGSGILLATVIGPLSLDTSLPALFVGLAIAAWLCLGRASNGWLAAMALVLMGALSMSMVFSVHADLSTDLLIRSIAVISMGFTASFFGGLFKQISEWFPAQTPIGIRILSSWMVALIAIQLAMSTLAS
jgi:hypothetical protein